MAWGTVGRGVVCVGVLLAGVSGSGCTSCEPMPVTSGASGCAGDGVRAGCSTDRECQGGFCRLAVGASCGVCGAIDCTTDADCEDGERCDTQRALCEPIDACVFNVADAGCTDGAWCASAVDDARCTMPDITGCAIVPATVVDEDGAAPPEVAALALDADGRPQPGVPRWTWEAARVTATFDGADGAVTCEAPRFTLAPRANDVVRVIGRDARDGAVLEGARVDVEGNVAITDARGVAEVKLDHAPARVEVSHDGFERTQLLDMDARTLDVRLPPAVAPGLAAGASFDVDLNAMPRRGDIRVALVTASLPNLVDGLRVETLLGFTVATTIRVEGITSEEGEVIAQPSGAAAQLGNDPLFVRGAVFGAPGVRAVSALAGSAGLGAFSPRLGAVVLAEDPRPYDLVLTLWELVQRTAAFDVAGSRTLTLGDAPVLGEQLATFEAEEGVATLRPIADATGELDVAVPLLAAGHDVVLVGAFARVPARGLVPLALRFVRDGDEDGALADDSDGDLDDDGVLDNADGSVGVVRLFVPPALWTVDRPVVVLAASGRYQALRDGALPTERVLLQIEPGQTQTEPLAPPAWLPMRAPIVDGATLTLQPRTLVDAPAVPLVLVRGRDNDGAPFHMWVGGARTQLEAPGVIDEVWTVDLAEDAADAWALGRAGDVLERALRARRLFPFDDTTAP